MHLPIINRPGATHRAGFYDKTDSTAIGCTQCAHKNACGGMTAGAIGFDCSSLCCGQPKECKYSVCPNKPEEFVRRFLEVDGFDLGTVHVQASPKCEVAPYLPVVDGKACRVNPLHIPFVVVPLQSVSVKFANPSEFATHFGIGPMTKVVLGGVGLDRKIERLWPQLMSSWVSDLCAQVKPWIIWTPNFSLFADAPRTNDLHSMKRIAMCAERIADQGVSPAIHLQARTPRDFGRWTQFLKDNPVDLVAFEFRTLRGKDRPEFIKYLVSLASNVNKPLSILVRGSAANAIALRHAFERVSIVDTVACQLARRRYRFEVKGERLTRVQSWSLGGQDVDDLSLHNIRTASDFFTAKLAAR